MREPAPLPSMPATWVLPSAGARSPAMTLSMVDLPQPEGPTMETNSPSATVRLTRSSARVAPNAMLSPETETFCGTRCPLLLPDPQVLGGHDLVVGDVAFDRARLLLELVQRAHCLFGDGRVVGVFLDGDDGTDDTDVEGGEDLLSDADGRLGVFAHALEGPHHGAHELLSRLRIGRDPLVAGLERGEGHELEESRSLADPRGQEVALQFEFLPGDGARGLASHEAVDLPRLERGISRAHPADGDDGDILVSLEARVLEKRSQREVRSTPRPCHAELRALEVLDTLGGVVPPQHKKERVLVLEGHEVLGAEALLGEDQRPLGHGSAQIDGPADHGSCHFGPTFAIHQLRGDALGLEVSKLLGRIDGQEDERWCRPDLDRLLSMGGRRAHAEHGDERGDDGVRRPHGVSSWTAERPG